MNDKLKLIMMRNNMLICLILILTTTSLFGQANYVKNASEKKEITPATSSSTKTVVVNEKMIAKYKDFIENGEYVSLWETIKEYDFNGMAGYYKTYKNYDFIEGTTYADIKKAYENNSENLAEDTESLKKESSYELLSTKNQ